MSTALITGNRGFVGSYLQAALTGDGWAVHGFDLRDGDDLRDYEQIRLRVEEVNPDYVFHLAAQPYVPETMTDIRRGFAINVNGTLNLMEAIRHTGCHARIHVAGTSEEYGYKGHGDAPVTESTSCLPTTPYGISKLAAGHLGLVYAATYGMNVVVTRAWNHIGPGQSHRYAVSAFARRVAEVKAGRRDRVVHGNLSAVRNYTDVRDIVAAYRLAIGLDSGVYNLCSDWTVTMQVIMDELVGHAGCEVKTDLDDALYRPATSEFPAPSSGKFRGLTGWVPTHDMTDTLAEMLAYWEDVL